MPDIFFVKGEKMEEKKIGKTQIVVLVVSAILLVFVLIPTIRNRIKYPREPYTFMSPVHSFETDRPNRIKIVEPVQP